MADKDSKAAPITPQESLASLPAVEFSPEKTGEQASLAQAELLQSVLLIGGLDHVAESRLVRDVVKTALGRVPEIGE